MSLFGYIFDKDAKFSNGSEINVNVQCIKTVTNFIDEKVRTYKSQWFPNSDCDTSPTSNVKSNQSANGKTTDHEKIEGDQVKRFDLSPKNADIVDYCKSLINISFHGQCEIVDSIEAGLLPPTVVTIDVKLSEAVKGIDELLRTVDKDFSGEEEEFQFYVHACTEARNPKEINKRRFQRKFFQDAKKFVQIYKERNGKSYFVCI